MQAPSRAARHAILDRHRLDLAEQRVCFLRHSPVACDQDDRRVIGTCKRCIEPRFAHDLAVEAQFDRMPAPGVLQHRRACARCSVVADEEDGVHLRTDTLHHTEGLGAAGDQLCDRVQFLDQDVRHPAVTVVDDDLIGATSQRALNSSVGLGGHQFAEALVLLVARPGVITRHHTGDAFHVYRDQHVQRGPSITGLKSAKLGATVWVLPTDFLSY